MKFIVILAFMVICSTNAAAPQQQPIPTYPRCLDTEADAEIKKRIQRGVRADYLKSDSIGAAISKLCDVRFPQEAIQFRRYPRYVETLAQDHINKVRQAENENMRQREAERERAMAPLLKAEDAAASTKYGECLFRNARLLALSSQEAAKTIAKATLASCRTERGAILDVHRRYGDTTFSRGALDIADREVTNDIILEIVKARGAHGG